MPRLSFHGAGLAAVLLASAAPVAAQNSVASAAAYAAEDSSARLLRHMRVLAKSPRDFTALVGAGDASLELGDTQAAAGFFGRAEEVWPASPLPQAGMGSAMVAMGDARGALNYFARAQQRGAAQASIAADRGLAFDLIGDQARAQSDYRAALFGRDADEARRRLALSLAISGDLRGSRDTIAPLLQRGDREATRINAFILALAGDRDGARRSIDATMPGAGARFDPFFKILPVLRPEEKAAAVHFGEFPKDAAERYAYAQPIATSPTLTVGGSRQTIVAAPKPPQRSASLVQRTPPAPKSTTKTPAQARKRIREPFYASNDPARFRSTSVVAATRRPKTQPATPKAAEPAPADPEPRPAERLNDIAQLLSAAPAEPKPAPETKLAASTAPPPAPQPKLEIDVPPAPEPKVETPRAKAAKAVAGKAATDKAKAAEKKAADKQIAEKKAAEKKAAEKKAAEKKAAEPVSRHFVQLASGSNADRLPLEFKKIKAKKPSLFSGRAVQVSKGKDLFRLVVGPFKSKDDSREFINALAKAGIDSFSYTAPDGLKFEKIASR